MTGGGDGAARRVRSWRRITRVLQIALAGTIAFGVWSLAIAADDGPAPILPDTEEQFSLDLAVIGSTDADIVYVVEQRARPSYRIFSFDAATGAVETVFTVPTDAIIYGIALNDDRDTLAVAYSPDYRIDGSGLALVDLTAGLPVQPVDLRTVVDATTGRYLTDVVWRDAGTVLATNVDRRGEDEELSVVAVAADDGSIDTIATDAVDPAPADDVTYFLDVDDERARRAIGLVDATGERSAIERADGRLDLDQLVVTDTAINVAVVEVDDGSITVGSTAEAHGNHDVPSAWWTVAADPTSSGSAWFESDLAETIVYDTSATGTGFVYATREGLSFGDPDAGEDGKVDVIASRALRFVAA